MFVPPEVDDGATDAPVWGQVRGHLGDDFGTDHLAYAGDDKGPQFGVCVDFGTASAAMISAGIEGAFNRPLMVEAGMA